MESPESSPQRSATSSSTANESCRLCWDISGRLVVFVSVCERFTYDVLVLHQSFVSHFLKIGFFPFRV